MQNLKKIFFLLVRESTELINNLRKDILPDKDKPNMHRNKGSSIVIL